MSLRCFATLLAVEESVLRFWRLNCGRIWETQYFCLENSQQWTYLHKVYITQRAGTSFGTSQAHNDDTDQWSNRKNVRHANARGAIEFSHDWIEENQVNEFVNRKRLKVREMCRGSSYNKVHLIQILPTYSHEMFHSTLRWRTHSLGYFGQQSMDQSLNQSRWLSPCATANCLVDPRDDHLLLSFHCLLTPLGSYFTTQRAFWIADR